MGRRRVLAHSPNPKTQWCKSITKSMQPTPICSLNRDRPAQIETILQRDTHLVLACIPDDGRRGCPGLAFNEWPHIIVLLSFIRTPLTFDGRKAFTVEVRDDCGAEHHLVSTNPPDIFDADGYPIALVTELSAGSRINIDNVGRVMRAIQVIEHRITNPFRRPA